MAGPDWFRLNRNLHRDVGYALCVVTLLYAVSGLAVNHTADWNPTYDIVRSDVDVGPFDPTDLAAAERHVVTTLALDAAEVRGRHHVSPHELKVFLVEGGEVVVDPATGHGHMERVTPRPLLFSANALHLNRLKGAWTFVADLYAILLFYLAAGGIFMLRGKTGLGGRGKWLVALGAVVPIGFLLFA